ncbi:hypothetical protein PMIN03_003902 [Paraphaeosphaeria minitans]
MKEKNRPSCVANLRRVAVGGVWWTAPWIDVEVGEFFVGVLTCVLDVLRMERARPVGVYLGVSIQCPHGAIATPCKDRSRIRPHTCRRLHRFEPSALQRRAAFANVNPPHLVLLSIAAQRRVIADDIYGNFARQCQRVLQQLVSRRQWNVSSTMDPKTKVDTTYKIYSPPDNITPFQDNSPSTQAPEKLFPIDQEPTSSKEAVHDAPEVVLEPWLVQQQRRPTSPYSMDDTVVAGFQPLEFDEKGQPVSRRVSELPSKKASKTCGIPRRYLFGLIILIFVVVTALGLGLGLSEIDPYCAANPNFCIGGALGSSYYTRNGTFNGSGIALATEFWNNQERKIMTVYFQHWTGEIRSIQLTPKGEWIGGTASEVVVSDAKNATPISAVSYSLNDTSVWHIFYISQDGHVKQKVNSNSTNIWQDGPLNALNLTAYGAPNVGLQACWYGNYYGDSDATKFPLRDGNNATIPFTNSTPGMHLWYPTSASTFQQYGWYQGQPQWLAEHTWPAMNAHAGVACYSWQPGPTTYAMMVDTHDTATLWWRDTNTTRTPTPAHPIDTWTNATRYAIPHVHPSTSLGFTEYLYAQMADGSVAGYDVAWAAEGTRGVEANGFTVGSARGPVPGLRGTHLSVTAVGDRSGGTSLYVFYQTRGDDLSVFTRDLEGGQWTQGELPIPDA